MANTKTFALALIACFIFPHLSYADGMPSIRGVSGEGYTVVIECEGGETCGVEIWKESKNPKESEQSIRHFYDEPCKYEESVDKHGKQIHSLSCASSAKSPLAGTRYIGRNVHGHCERGEPHFRYTCVSGCSGNSRAPQEMTQGYWEC